ncbi:claudin-4-like [Cyprinodon tularosa]|uniref:claudin-4-like n=1 Tax=Cyprinodon tularosa TaxID=77115 RepID=UPI0018E23176|nr:claudin-4-like [Cyprinodon tularosa]
MLKRMESAVQMVSMAFGVIGLIGAILCCVLPLWKVTTFIGANIFIAQEIQVGLWMTCVTQSTGQQQCKVYDSMLDLPSDLHAARAMVIIACIFCGLSLLILFFGADFTTCVQNEDAKPKICLVAGVGLLLGGPLVIIPVRWLAAKLKNPSVPDAQNRELGACIYIGWAAGVLMIMAGGLLCCFSRPKSSSSEGTAKYYSSSASAPGKNYV